MYSKFIGKGKNNGSANDLVDYGAKEVVDKKEKVYFNHRGRFSISEAKKLLRGASGLKKHEDKFFHLVASPSQEELASVQGDEELEKFTIAVMDNYAESFGKGFTKEDFEYVVVLHHDRDLNQTERGYKPLPKTYSERHEKKEGDQRHPHIFIRRILRDGKTKASPLSNFKKISENSNIKQGFDRNEFKRMNERTFDMMFDYARPITETYDYAREMWGRANGEKMEIQKQFREDIKESKEFGIPMETYINRFQQKVKSEEKKKAVIEEEVLENAQIPISPIFPELPSAEEEEEREKEKQKGLDEAEETSEKVDLPSIPATEPAFMEKSEKEAAYSEEDMAIISEIYAVAFFGMEDTKPFTDGQKDIVFKVLKIIKDGVGTMSNFADYLYNEYLKIKPTEGKIFISDETESNQVPLEIFSHLDEKKYPSVDIVRDILEDDGEELNQSRGITR